MKHGHQRRQHHPGYSEMPRLADHRKQYRRLAVGNEVADLGYRCNKNTALFDKYSISKAVFILRQLFHSKLNRRFKQISIKIQFKFST